MSAYESHRKFCEICPEQGAPVNCCQTGALLAGLELSLEAERAATASLRVKLQIAHGALYCLRHPEDGNKAIDQWRFSPTGLRDLAANYDIKALMESTRPLADGEGLDLLMELRELREQVASVRLLAVASTTNITGAAP